MRSPDRHAPRRAATAVAMLAATALAVAGCANARPGPGPGAGTATSTTTLISSGTGWVTVTAPKGQSDAPALRIRAAALYPGAPHGGEELRMSVTNDSAAAEHLYGVTSTHIAGSELFNAPTTTGAQPQLADGTGIALEPGSTTTFGPGGPRILLTRPIALVAGRPVELTLDFSLAGLVHLTALPGAAPTSSPAGAAG